VISVMKRTAAMIHFRSRCVARAACRVGTRCFADRVGRTRWKWQPPI
jgi:hypothetical protein